MAEKSNIIYGHATLSVDGADAGYTTDGVKYRVEKDLTDVECDQIRGVLDKIRGMERAFVETTLLESTLQNLKVAWSQAAGNLVGGTFLAIGTNTSSVGTHVLTLTGSDAPGSKTTRTITMYRAAVISEGETVHMRGEPNRIPITFECLKDPLNNNLFGHISDT